MLKKHTLTIDQSVIAQAKAFSRKKHTSVSRIVEDYLRNIAAEDEAYQSKKNLVSPITDSLVGMFADSKKDYSALLEEPLLEKHT